MASKLAILHTTPATLEPLKALAGEILPGVGLINILDDSVLPQLAGNDGDLAAVAPRLVAYALAAEQAGAAVILSACSSVGEVVAYMREQVTVPVVRIDEAMAEQATGRGEGTIGVAATLPTTLGPTLRLLYQAAADAGKQVTLQPLLVEAAYRALAAGDQAGHDRLLAEALAELAAVTEVVVLAQASMARVLPALPEAVRGKFLTSPRLALERVKAILEAQHAG